MSNLGSNLVCEGADLLLESGVPLNLIHHLVDARVANLAQDFRNRGMTLAEIGRAFDRSRTWVASLLRELRHDEPALVSGAILMLCIAQADGREGSTTTELLARYEEKLPQDGEGVEPGLALSKLLEMGLLAVLPNGRVRATAVAAQVEPSSDVQLMAAVTRNVSAVLLAARQTLDDPRAELGVRLRRYLVRCPAEEVRRAEALSDLDERLLALLSEWEGDWASAPSPAEGIEGTLDSACAMEVRPIVLASPRND